MTGGTLLETLAEFAVSVRGGGVPAEVATSVRERILDVLGLQAAGLAVDTARAVLEFVGEQGGAAQAHAIGLREPVPACWAAFSGGVLAHVLDYDDTHLPSIVHPSASVVPATMAAAELGGASGAMIVPAVAVGLEVTVRVGMAGFDRESSRSLYFEHGQHATSVCGTIGSAAAAAMVLGGGKGQICHAMAVAASTASGIVEANRMGGTVKRLHCGWAAHAGVAAAQLALKGVTGPSTALEGRFGLFQALLRGRFDAGEIVEGLGDRWEVPRICFKPYPANHFTHAGIDAALRLRDRGVAATEVKRAVLRVATPAVRSIGEPIERKQRPQTGYQAQFSGPYTVAAALFGGSGLGLNLDDFTDELVRDQARRELMTRVDVRADPACDAVYPYQLPAILEVETLRGQRLEERVMVNRGGPDDPLSKAELAAKFRDNASRVLPAETIDAITDAVSRLDSLERAAEVMELVPGELLETVFERVPEI